MNAVVDTVGRLTLSGLTTFERVFMLWKGLLDGNIFSWQCNSLDIMYVYILLLWFFANKGCLRQGITCMHYLQLAKLWLAGITRCQQCTSLHFIDLSFSVLLLFCPALFFSVLLPCVLHSAALSLLSLYSPLFLYSVNQFSIFLQSYPLNKKSLIWENTVLFHTVVFPSISPFLSAQSPVVSSHTQRMPHYLSKFHYRKSCYLGEAIT